MTSSAPGKEIKGEGRTVTTEGQLVATAVKFETEDEDEEEFEGFVLTADRVTGLLTLLDTTMVVVDADTEWDDDGDFITLSALADAVEAGAFVEVEGEGRLLENGSILASKINAKDSKFELEIEPDEWDDDWADGSTSGKGGVNIEARIEDGPVGDIDPTSVEMEGPVGPPISWAWDSGSATTSPSTSSAAR